MKNNKEKEAGAEGKTEDPEGEGEPGGEDSRGDAGTESAGQLGQLGWGRPRTELRVTRREKRVRGDLSRRPAGRSRGGEGRTRWGRCPQGGNHHKAHQRPPPPTQGAPSPGDENMEEEKNAAEEVGAGEDKGDDVAGGDTNMAAGGQQQDAVEPGEEQYQEPEDAGDRGRPPPGRASGHIATCRGHPLVGCRRPPAYGGGCASG